MSIIPLVNKNPVLGALSLGRNKQTTQRTGLVNDYIQLRSVCKSAKTCKYYSTNELGRQFGKGFALVRIRYDELDNAEMILQDEIENHTGQPLEVITPHQGRRIKSPLFNPTRYRQALLL